MDRLPKSRLKKASYNIISSVLLEILTMISSFILPRFILAAYGSSYNGITTSVSQYLSLISILTLGVTASTRVALYKSFSADDWEGTSAIVRGTERYMRRVGMVLLIYVLILAGIYPVLVHTGFSYWQVASLILIVGMSSFAEYFFGITYRTFLLADQSVYISNIFSCASVVLNAIIAVLLIKKGYSIQIVKLGSATVFILRPLLQNLYVTKKYKFDKKCEPNIIALKTRGDAMMHALANLVHDHTDLIVLTLFTDVKIVSVYSIYNMVMCALKKIQTIFTTGTEPLFGSMWAKGEFEKIEKNLNVFEFFVCAYNSTIFGIAMVMILPFVSIYIPSSVKDVNYIEPVYAVVISLAFATQGIRVPYLALVQGIGHYKQTKKAAIIEAALNIIISVALVNIIGLTGVAVGTLVANLYRTIHYGVYIDNHVVHRGKWVFINKLIWAIFNLLLVVVPGWLIVQRLRIENWLQWILIACAVSSYASIIVLVNSFLFYRKDLKHAIYLGKAMLRKKR